MIRAPIVVVGVLALLEASCVSTPVLPIRRWSDTSTWGVFQNATAEEMRIDLFTSPKSVYATFYVGPGGCNESVIFSGTAVARALRGRGPVWTRREGALIAQGLLSFPKTVSGYDFRVPKTHKRNVYYLVSHGKLELMTPAEGRRRCP